MESGHIRGTAVGDGPTLLLHTDSSAVVNGNVVRNAGLVVKVEDASGEQLTTIAGRLAVWSDGTTMFHGAFPEFSRFTVLG